MCSLSPTPLINGICTTPSWNGWKIRSDQEVVVPPKTPEHRQRECVCASEVTLTSDQYSEIAQGYEERGKDLVADRVMPLPRLKAEPKFQARSWLAMAPFLTTLWIT